MSANKDKPDFSGVSGGFTSNKPAAPAERGPAGQPSTDTASKAPDFSSVQGGFDSSAQSSEANVVPAQSHTVQRGDSLSKIARRVYGETRHWRVIFEANRDQLDNPDLIHPGQVLKIPALTTIDDD